MFTSGFFNADKKGDEWDRTYKAEFFAKYFASFIGNGVFPIPASCMQVKSIDNNMQIKISAGKAWINGYYAENTDYYNITLTPADGALNRIDRVVLRLDFLERNIIPLVKQGYYSSTIPVAPILQRDTDAYEIALADINVSKGVIKINQSDITDLRLNSNYCGIVHGTVEQVDTTEIFNQYQSWFSEKVIDYQDDFDVFKEEKKNELLVFVEEFKNLLDPNSDAVAQLQSEITMNRLNIQKQNDVIRATNKVKRNVIISKSNWIFENGFYVYKILDTDITALSVVNINIGITYLAKAPYLKSANDSFEGYVKLYSERTPESDLICDMVIMNEVIS